MKHLTQQIIDRLIQTNSFIADYPKPGVIFLAMDSLFNDVAARKTISKMVSAAVDSSSFDAVAGIASRGYVFSGLIANQFNDKGEHFIQKVKVKGDARFVQLDMATEYSSDALQVLKNTIQKGKKYLLTDDLIATGGSVMSAIKLIRDGGGIVDKVFVMTELLDFSAKEKLKEVGVELISLLSLTNQDLQKLLIIQRCYQDNSSTPITYQLSHYIKDDSSLSQNIPSRLTVHLASMSDIKYEAVEMAFKGMLDPISVEIIKHDSDSGVNSQPLGYDETMAGAKNRLSSVDCGKVDSENDVVVSIENGLRYDGEKNAYYDFVQVMVKKRETIFAHTVDCCKVSSDVVNSIAKNDDGQFLETWGDAAKRMGLAENAHNPHQALSFGGISRKDHVFTALCQAVGQLKEHIMCKTRSEESDQQVNIRRLVNINYHRFEKMYAKKGVFFSPASLVPSTKSVDLYNHGCPIKSWNISPDKANLTSFKVFSTGDAFSIISQDADISGKNINIHVGTEHEQYSPLVLLHEALQLCRCAYEHGADGITVALPEKFHLGLNPTDFNLLLMKLFKSSGANKLYYYDKKYQGTLSNKSYQDTIPLALTNESDISSYQLGRNYLMDYLNLSPTVQATLSDKKLDDKVMHFIRRNRLQKAWSKFDVDHHHIIENLTNHELAPHIQLPIMESKPHVLLCGSANKPLAERIAASLRERGENVLFYQIEGSGTSVSIPQAADICGAIITIVQSTRPNPDNLETSEDYLVNGASAYFFETAIIANQARLRGAERINLINPYQYSARSDKAENSPHGKTGSYVQLNGRLLEAAGVNHVITAECHDVHTLSGSYTGKDIKGSAVPGLEILSANIARDWVNRANQSTHGKLRLVTPDAGATKRTNELTAKLRHILGDKLSDTRILGEKQRDSHNDDSAVINGFNMGSVGINPDDKYLITDDETATGSTLCQAISNLTNQGAKDIAVAVVHNNMPLDWLHRQLCLARFIYLGVNDLHFSDTQEMGRLANGYDDLIMSYSQQSGLTIQEVERQVLAWLEKNLVSAIAGQNFDRFKDSLKQMQSSIFIHTLAKEFADKVSDKSLELKSTDEKVADNTDQMNRGNKGYFSNAGIGFSLFSKSLSREEVNETLVDQDEPLVVGLK